MADVTRMTCLRAGEAQIGMQVYIAHGRQVLPGVVTVIDEQPEGKRWRPRRCTVRIGAKTYRRNECDLMTGAKVAQR